MAFLISICESSRPHSSMEWIENKYISIIIGNADSPLLVAKYRLLFLVPVGSRSSKNPSVTKNLSRLERILVAIFL